MKHLLLASLLVSPLALHAQLFGLSSSCSLSDSSIQNVTFGR